MKFFRRWLILASAIALGAGSLAAMATALSVSVTSVFTGKSKHRHYGINLVPECFTSACTNATTVGIQVTTGNAAHPAAKCVYGTFQLLNARLHRDGSFAATGEASTVAKTFTLKVSGVFTSPHKVHGTVHGPRLCGGTDTFRLSATTVAGG